MDNEKKTAKRKGRAVKALWILFSVCLILFLIAIAYFSGRIQESLSLSGVNQAKYALRKTGLPADDAPVFSLYGTWGFRDFLDITVFNIEWETDRAELFDAMKDAQGWTCAPVTSDEYDRFADAAFWSYADVVMIPEDMMLDAWYYRVSTEPSGYESFAPKGPFEEIGQIARGFEFAVYDVETGFFALIDQFG